MKHFKVTVDEYVAIVEAETPEEARELAVADFEGLISGDDAVVEEASPEEVIEWEGDCECGGECGKEECDCTDGEGDETELNEWLDEDEEKDDDEEF